MKKRNFVFVAMIILLSACDDSESIDYSGTYVSASVKTSSVRMFTRKGEVKKHGVIDAFLPEDIAADFFIFSNPPDVSGEISVEFLEDGLVAMTEYGNVETKALTLKNGILYLEASETGTILIPANQEFSFGELLKYKPLYTDTAILAFGSGYRYAVDVKECVYLQPAGNEIRIPIFSFYYKHSYGGLGYSSSAARQNNAFNKDSYKKLAESDTLVVQEAYIVLKKQ